MTIQFLRGNTAKTAAYTGAVGEVTVDTDKKVLVVHDAVTAGGSPMARENSPAFTGTPTVPTPPQFDSSTKAATTAFVQNAIGSMGFRNIIINGDMRVGQRPPAAAALNANVYGGADRFYVNLASFSSASGTISQQYSGGAGYVGLFQYAQSVTGVTTTGSGYINFGQRIESRNSSSLNGRTISIQAYVLQQTGAPVNYQFTLIKPTGAGGVDDYSASALIVNGIGSTSVPSGVWTKVSATYNLSSSDATNGLELDIQATGLGALSSKNFYVTGVQVEAAAVATAFEQRHVGLELSLCQRYYQNNLGVQLTAYQVGGSSFTTHFGYPSMRAAPTVTFSGGTMSNCSGLAAINAGNSSFRLAVVATTTGVIAAYDIAVALSAEL